MKRLYNKITLILSLLLIVLTLFAIKGYSKTVKQREYYENSQSTKDKFPLLSKEVLINKLNKENKILVLSGEAEIEVLYSNKDLSDNDAQLTWLKDWFTNINSKDLQVKAVYKYQFHYDLDGFDIELKDNIPYINLSRNRLSCQVEQLEGKSIYNDRVGFLESKFTPQEINSLNGRTKDLAYNKIQSKKNLRDEAIKNAQSSIEDILGVKCVFNVSEIDVVEYNNKSVKIN